jgi:hypothetical protein
MRMQIVHAFKRSVLYQRLFLDTSNLGAGRAGESRSIEAYRLGIRLLREERKEPLRKAA